MENDYYTITLKSVNQVDNPDIKGDIGVKLEFNCSKNHTYEVIFYDENEVNEFKSKFENGKFVEKIRCKKCEAENNLKSLNYN